MNNRRWRLGGWHYAGIVLSILWALGFCTWVLMANDWDWGRVGRVRWGVVALYALPPIPLGWGIAYFIVLARRWARQVIPRVNLSRGLFRVWIMLSVAWSAWFLYQGLGSFKNQYGQHWELSKDDLIVILIPWLLIGAAIGLRWAIRGFRSDHPPEAP